jgi:uncharacterized membrane protein
MSLINILQIIIFLLAIVGISTARKIWKEKNTGQPFVCPLGGKCNNVIHSKYGNVLGLGMEKLGFVFYALIILFVLFLAFSGSSVLISNIYPLFFLLTLIGFIFSVYLTCLQAFVIKDWCTWCLLSALTSTLIFITNIFYFLNSGFKLW